MGIKDNVEINLILKFECIAPEMDKQNETDGVLRNVYSHVFVL